MLDLINKKERKTKKIILAEILFIRKTISVSLSLSLSLSLSTTAYARLPKILIGNTAEKQRNFAWIRNKSFAPSNGKRRDRKVCLLPVFVALHPLSFRILLYFSLSFFSIWSNCVESAARGASQWSSRPSRTRKKPARDRSIGRNASPIKSVKDTDTRDGRVNTR